MPIVSTDGLNRIVAAARRYSELVNGSDHFTLGEPDEVPIRHALRSIDATVLHAYDLPPRLERQLLDFFRGAERKGVGCTFGDYFPVDFKPYIPLHEYISEAYKRSTVGEFVKRFQPVRSQAALAALDAAEKLAAGD